MMLCILQVLTVLFIAVAMALSLAHALELPGKMRLAKEAYYAMQPIYYPGYRRVRRAFWHHFNRHPFVLDAVGER